MSIFRTIADGLAFGRRGKSMRPSTRWSSRDDAYAASLIGLPQGAGVPVIPGPDGRPRPAPPEPMRLDPTIRTTLGRTYRDKISGFEGIAMGKCQYLTGCDQTCLKPQGLKDGKPIEMDWFDDMRLELVKDGPSAYVGASFTGIDQSQRVENGADFPPPGGRAPPRPRV